MARATRTTGEWESSSRPLPRGREAPLAAGLDEALEKCPLRRAVGQQLGVPLDAEEERAMRVLDRLDRPVIGECRRDEALTERSHRLVVEGVDLEPVCSDELRERT